MGIKRGVSLYSYQQATWFGTMSWRDQLKEVATGLNGATGIEIISETTIPNYPYPSDAFIDEWNFEMARWGLTATTYDAFPDPMQFRRDHVMNEAELAERLKIDLRLAKRMGFQNIRVLGNTIKSVELALPLAEELGISISQEVHFPSGLRANGNPHTEKNIRILEYIEKTGTKYYGFQPDFGIFLKEPARITLAYHLRRAGYEDIEARTDEIIAQFHALDTDRLVVWALDKYKEIFSDYRVVEVLSPASAVPEDLRMIGPYIKCCHGKFYQMTEIPGEPGHYEERSLDYSGAIAVLKELGYEGYIDSEYEGQRSYQDQDAELLADEVEEVRRHHEMMARLIGE